MNLTNFDPVTFIKVMTILLKNNIFATFYTVNKVQEKHYLDKKIIQCNFKFSLWSVKVILAQSCQKEYVPNMLYKYIGCIGL